MARTVITGTGSYIPEMVQRNSDFLNHRFFTENQEVIDAPSGEITEKFQNITGIKERRYVTENLHTSDIGVIAARRAIEDSGIDPET
ncbi:MAG: ketoacyl-ACP synthase III, partial [Owenweeksia sp.]